MKTSLRKKILIFSFFALFVPLGLSVFFDVQAIFESYRQSLNLRLQLQAESLRAEIEKVQNLGLPLEEIQGLNSRCQELVQRDPDLAYCLIETLDRRILYAHDPSLAGGRDFPPAVDESPQMFSGFRDWGLFYDISVPIQNASKETTGRVRLGFLRSVLLDLAKESILRNLLIFIGVFTAIYFVIVAYLQKHLLSPINRLCQMAQRLTDGDFEAESVELATSEFQALADNLSEMAAALAERDRQIAAGMEDLEKSNELLQDAYETQESISTELKHSKMLYQALVDQASEAIIVCNANDEVQLFNNQSELFFGLKAAEVLELNLLRFFEKIGVSHIDDLYDMYQSVIQTGVGADEFSFVDASGSEKWGLIRAAALRGADGEDLIQMIVHDVTLEHQARLSLEKSTAQLQRLNRMKNSFLGMVSHELKTPLTIILGYADLLEGQRNISLDPVLKESLGHIIDAAERLGRVIQDMVDASDLDGQRIDLKRELLDLNRLISDCSESLRPQAADRNQTISLVLAENLPEIEADRSRLKQMMEHLLSNAIKFTPDNGRILLSSTYHPSGSSGATDCSSPEGGNVGCVEIVVADDGIGIPADEQEHVFDKFYGAGPIEEHSSSRTSFKGKGVGLGLTIVQGIVELHGGEIWIDKEHASGSEEHSGSAFHVRLPTISHSSS